jgi:histidinol-phosphate aminotransferase
LLELVARAFLGPSDEALTSEKSFVMYYLAPQQMNCPVRQAPMKNYSFDLDAIRQAVTPRTKIIYLANPNNPTGTMFRAPELDCFLKDLPNHIVVVVDEAYFEYVEDPEYSHSLDYRKQYENVLVLRTFSKAYALAGFRIGYGIGQPELVNALHKIRPPFNTSSIGQVAALAALDDLDFVRRSVKTNRAGYRFLSHEMERLGVFFVPSVANFILVETGRDCMEEFQQLLRQGVIVRPMKANGFPGGFRVSIGIAAENERFISALEAILPPA